MAGRRISNSTSSSWSSFTARSSAPNTWPEAPAAPSIPSPIAHQHRVGAINWGLVAGKSQTYLPWDSWQHPYVDRQPIIWFHDVFHPDGAPYRQREVEIIRTLTNEK